MEPPARKKPRSRKGSGTVFQRFDGRWVARTPPVDGVQRKFVRQTKAEARAALSSAFADGLGSLPTPTIPLGTYAKRWLASLAESSLAASTIETYRTDVINHVLPRLGAIPIGNLTSTRVAEWLTAMQREGVGVRAVAKSFAALRRILSQAVSDGVIAANPAKALDTSRKPRYTAPPATILTFAQVQRLLAEVASHRLGALVVLTAYTGARQSEYIGLRWRDLDLAQPRISITRNLVLVGNEHAAGRTKTRTSSREIELPQVVIPGLRAHLAAMRAEDQDTSANALVFPSRRGTPLRRQNLLRAVLYPALARARLPRITWHQMRHSLATTLIEAGEPVEVVSRLLGHADPTITMRVYSQAFARRQRQAADTIDQLARENKVPNKVPRPQPRERRK